MPSSDLIPIYHADTGTVRELNKVIRTDEEWSQILDRNVFDVARKGGTEPAFTGAFYATKIAGQQDCTGVPAVGQTSFHRWINLIQEPAGQVFQHQCHP